MPSKKNSGHLTTLLIILAIIAFFILVISFTIYIGYRASMSEQKLFSTSLLAIFAGLLFESFRMTNKWKNVIFDFLCSFVISLLSFIPFKKEYVYNLESHIELWPYFFIFIFSIFTIVSHEEKVTAKLSEGITLLQSLSIIYWTIEYGFLEINNLFVKSLLAIALIFSVFSIIHALTYITLSRTARFWLSVWSTMIMVAFALDNIYHVYQNEEMETTQFLSQGLMIGLEFFLLGVSIIYILKDFMLLAGFLPSKNGNYRRDLKELKNEHIKRYSQNQVSIGYSIFCILFAFTFYGINLHYHVLPSHTMIWLVFFTFPYIFEFAKFLFKKSIA